MTQFADQLIIMLSKRANSTEKNTWLLNPSAKIMVKKRTGQRKKSWRAKMTEEMVNTKEVSGSKLVKVWS